MKRIIRLAEAACLVAATLALPAAGGPARAATDAAGWRMEGTKQIALHTRDGKTIPVGRITFTPGGKATRFTIDWDTKPFEVYFLSMRNFQCVNGPEVTCAVPYPYDNPQTATPGDLNWLSDNLLFMYKTTAEHAATMTNGMRFDLKLTSDGISGKPQAINLDDIASPPKDPTAPPYGPGDRDDYPEGSRYVDALTIR